MIHPFRLRGKRRLSLRAHGRQRVGASLVVIATMLLVTSITAGGREFYLGALAMATWCSVAAWRRMRLYGRSRRAGWGAVSAGSAAAAIGQAWWLANPPANAEGVAMLPGHVGMIAATLLSLAAAIAFRPPRRESAESLPLVLDLVIISSTLAGALWTFLIEPSRDWDSSLSAREAITFAHAGSGGLLLLGLFVIELRFPDSGGSRSLALLVASLAGIGGAQLAWTAAWINGGVAGAETGASLTAIAFTLLAIALAGERRRFEMEPPVVDEPCPESSWRVWMLYPSVALLSLIAADALLCGRNGGTNPVVTLGSLTVIVLALARLGIAARDARRTAFHLHHQAERDPLTSLLNHRALHGRLEREMAGTRRHGHPLAVALIDVDRFKEINDQLGHVVGDHVLRAIAATLTRACRASDVAARYAGDEFALILPGLDGSSAAVVGERLLDEVAALGYWPGPDADAPVSISIGFAISRTARQSGRQMIAAADEALYRAKRAGRNRFAVLDADAFEHEPDPTVDLRRIITIHPIG